MLALNRHVVVPFFRNFLGIIIDSRMFEVHFSIFESEDSDILNLRIARLVVFFDTCVNTTSAADTSLEIQRVSEEGRVDWTFCPYNKIFPIFLFIFWFLSLSTVCSISPLVILLKLF